MATVAETLEMAADKLAAPGAWIGGPGTMDSWAQNAHGAEVAVTDPSACKFCLYGAIEASAPDVKTDAAAASLLAEMVGTPMLSMWNHHSSRTQAEVVSALRAAAAKSREVLS